MASRMRWHPQLACPLPLWKGEVSQVDKGRGEVGCWLEYSLEHILDVKSHVLAHDCLFGAFIMRVLPLRLMLMAMVEKMTSE